jgi:microcompartment protein CcmK/EutM
VIGTVVSTINHPIYDSRKLLLCELLDASAGPTPRELIAIDRVGAGVGETVLILDEGNSARQLLAAENAPVRAVVVGIVDQLVVGGETLIPRQSES